MMPVAVCFVVPQNQNKKFKQKLLFAYINVACSLLPIPSSADNSAYLSMSQYAIWTEHVQLFCVEV